MIFAHISAALSRVNWKLQDIRLRKILTATLVSTLLVTVGPALDVINAPTAHADGTGLSIYWKNESGSTTGITRSEFTSGTCATATGNIDYSWGTGSPSGCNTDGFTTFATGYIGALSSSDVTYNFCNQSDDGFYLTINGTTVIDNWSEHGSASGQSCDGTGNFTFTANTSYTIRIWHHENAGGAVARLLWKKSSDTTYVIIPAKNLATTQSPLAGPTLTFPSVITSYDYGNTSYNYGANLASGGTGTYTYSLVAGTLPSILQLNTTTGAIVYNSAGSCTSSTTTTGLKIRVTDANGMYGETGSFSVTTCPVVPATYPASATSTIGGYTFTIQNFDSTLTYSGTTSAVGGSVSVNASTGLVTVTGLGVGATSSVTLTAAKSGEISKSSTSPSTYSSTPKITLTTPGSLSASVTAGVAKTINVSWTDVSNESRYQITLQNGATTVATINLSANTTSRTITTADYSGLADGTLYAVNLVAGGDGVQYDTSTAASTTVTTNQSARVATFGTATRQSLGFSVSLSNYDNTFTYETATASAGSVSFSNGTFVVTGLSKGQGSTVTISTRKSGYVSTTTTSSTFYALDTATAFSLNSKTLTLGANYKILYTADTNNPNKPTYTSSTLSVCTVNGETITPVTAGTCSISAILVGYSNYDTITTTANFTINSAPTFTATYLSYRRYGDAPSTYGLTKSGGVTPYSYTIVRKSTGETITGLTIDSNGLITFGQYLGAGTDSVTITITDANGVSFSRDDTLLVYKKNPTFTVTAVGETVTTQSKTLDFSITTTEYGLTGTVSLYISGGTTTPLTGCQNLDINSGTASCTATMEVYGINSFLLLGYSGNSNYYSKGNYPSTETSYGGGPTVTVNAPVYANYGTQNIYYGTTTYFTPSSVTNGTGPRSAWTWDIVRASDSQTVSGITMNQETITITAGLALGTYNMIVRVTDAKGVTSYLPATINLNKAFITFTTTVDSSSATVGKSITFTFTANKTSANGTLVLYQSDLSTTVTGCSSVSIVNGVGSCTWTRSTTYGPANVYYTYSGDPNFNDVVAKINTSVQIQFFPHNLMSYGTLTTNYGTAATLAGTYTARGGGAANTWSWSIVKRSDSSTVSGISMNGETITVSNTTQSATYLMTIITVDGLGDTTYTNVTVTVNPQSGLTPTFGAVTRTANGFTTSVSNYDSNYTFSASVSSGTVDSGTATGSTLPLTVTGLGDSVTATITVGTSRLNYTSPTATVQGTSLAVGITPTFGTITRTTTGFTVTVTNWSSSYSWSESVTAGSVSAGVGSGSNRTYTITGLTSAQTTTLTVWDTSTTTRLTSASITGGPLQQQAAVTVTKTSGTYPSETLAASGGSGTGAFSYALAGPATSTMGSTMILKAFTSGAHSLYSPDGSMLYVLNPKSGSSNLVRFVVSSGTFLSDITLPAYSNQMAMDPSGNYILVVSQTQVIKILTSTGETSTVVSSGLSNGKGIALDPTGTGDFYVTDNSNHKVFGFYSNGTSKFTTTTATNILSQSTAFGRAAITADGLKLYTIGTTSGWSLGQAALDAVLYEFNTATGALNRQITNNATDGMGSLAVTPNGKFAFAGNLSDGRIYAYSLLETLTTKSAIVLYQNYTVNQVSVSPDSGFVLATVGQAWNGFNHARLYTTAGLADGISANEIDFSTNTFGSPASGAISPDNKTGYLIFTGGLVPLTLAWGQGSAYCSISGTTISAKADGSCSITATKAADSDYLAETSTVTTFNFGTTTPLTIKANGATVNYSTSSLYTASSSVTGFVGSDTGTITVASYKYTGINGTSYAESSSKPTAVGTYSVTPSYGSLTFTSGYRGGYPRPTIYLSDTLTVRAVVPDSPTAVSASALSSTSARITFAAPVNNGGATITSYAISNGTDTVTATGSSSPITVTGLSPGTAYVFRINAINSVGRSDTASATSITMPLTVTISPSTTSGIFGVPISTITPTVIGGSGLTYSVTPLLPAGLTLNSDGTITGTPTETSTVKTYTETATATGTSGSGTFTITIAKATSSISVPSVSPMLPVIGSAMTFTSTVTSNTQATLTGTISFKNASNVLLCSTDTITAGVGSCDYTPATTDTFTVRAYYSGMTYVDSSTSVSALTVVPGKGNPSVTLTSSSLKLVANTVATLTTTIVTGTITNATGQVSYTANGTAIAGCTASSVSANISTCSYTPTSAGVFSILATYIGDGNFNGAVASSVSVTVSSCTQSSSGLTLSTGAPFAGYCAVAVTAGTSGSLGLPVGVISMSARIMIIGGGGSGGTRSGGGGGAGSLIYSDSLTISDTRTVTIGAGATGKVATNHGDNGGDTIFGSFTALGGGGGANNVSSTGYTGGSGGGGAGNYGGTAGSALQTAYSGFTAYVNAGGTGTSGGTGPDWTGGGGGGAGGPGGNGTARSIGGTGGAGRAMNMTLDGSYACFAAGGGGGADYPKSGGAGGSCTGNSTAKVGGDGSAGGTSPDAGNGVANTGSGGGGNGFGVSGNDQADTGYAGSGGSGLIAIRYISTPTITVPSDTSTAALKVITFAATAPTFGASFTRSYQWQFWDSATATWKNDTVTASATSLTYVFTAHYNGNGSQKYRLLVTDSDGSIQTTSASRTINLTVSPLPQPTLYLATTFGTAGTPLTIFTNGGGGSGAVTYTYISAGSAAGCSLTGVVLTLSTSGVCKVIASKAADLDYVAAVSDTATVTFLAFAITTQAAPSNPNTGIAIAEVIPFTKGSDACTSNCVPSISAVKNTSGTDITVLTVGSQIRMIGLSFNTTTGVYFYATIDGAYKRKVPAASFTVDSDTQLTVTPPTTFTPNTGENTSSIVVGIVVQTPGGLSGQIQNIVTITR